MQLAIPILQGACFPCISLCCCGRCSPLSACNTNQPRSSHIHLICNQSQSGRPRNAIGHPHPSRGVLPWHLPVLLWQMLPPQCLHNDTAPLGHNHLSANQSHSWTARNASGHPYPPRGLLHLHLPVLLQQRLSPQCLHHTIALLKDKLIHLSHLFARKHSFRKALKTLVTFNWPPSSDWR